MKIPYFLLLLAIQGIAVARSTPTCKPNADYIVTKLGDIQEQWEQEFTELFEYSPSSMPLTQTEAWIAAHDIDLKKVGVKELKKLSMYSWGSFDPLVPEHLMHLVEQILAREQQLASHFVFYHATSGANEAIMDAISYAVRLMNAVKKGTGVQVRMPNRLLKADKPLYAWYEEYFINSYIDDHHPDMRAMLMCLNLSLFGNRGNGGECTWEFFVSKRSVDTTSSSVISDLIGQYFAIDGSSALISQLSKSLVAYADALSDAGHLYQIFIKKDVVDQHVILTKAYGYPWKTMIDAGCYDTQLNIHTRIRPILERYIKDAKSIPDFNNLQGRLRFTPELITDSSGDITTFKYQSVDLNNRQDVHAARRQVRATIKKIAVQAFVRSSTVAASIIKVATAHGIAPAATCVAA